VGEDSAKSISVKEIKPCGCKAIRDDNRVTGNVLGIRGSGELNEETCWEYTCTGGESPVSGAYLDG
jgi:hypothetical protein